MAEWIVQVERSGPSSVRIRARSRVDGAAGDAETVLYWWVDGRLAQVALWVERPTLELSGDGRVDVQVFDDAGDVPSAGYPERFKVSWDAVALSERYVVAMDLGSGFVDQETLLPNGTEVLWWLSPRLDDGASVGFRVTAYSSSGVASVVREFSVVMVRRPDGFDGVFSYDSGSGDLTLSAVV